MSAEWGQRLMRLWHRRHHLAAQYVIAAVSVLAVALLAGRAVSLPGLFGGDSRFPLMLAATLPLSTLVSLTFSEQDDLEATAPPEHCDGASSHTCLASIL